MRAAVTGVSTTLCDRRQIRTGRASATLTGSARLQSRRTHRARTGQQPPVGGVPHRGRCAHSRARSRWILMQVANCSAVELKGSPQAERGSCDRSPTRRFARLWSHRRGIIETRRSGGSAQVRHIYPLGPGARFKVSEVCLRVSGAPWPVRKAVTSRPRSSRSPGNRCQPRRAHCGRAVRPGLRQEPPGTAPAHLRP
jgi:hypothetical protein